MAPIEQLDEERSRIHAIDAHLTATTGAVVDDVVLRAWGNEQVELTYLLLSAAITASGGVVDEADLWLVSRSIAFPQAESRPLAG
ncbi:hypothetical protein [Amnibacterium endophyticum]|uniref:Uncharacterized protein n=1 Tax=Amnibacterium endophyticum TaxID=2109337 RepID=A0ABW4LF16_9MICO